MPNYMLVKYTKELLKKLICEHCGSIEKNMTIQDPCSKMCRRQGASRVSRDFHKQPLGIREKLESVGVTLPKNLCYYQDFICYDFEAMFKDMNKRTEKTEYLSQHCPVLGIL